MTQKLINFLILSTLFMTSVGCAGLQKTRRPESKNVFISNTRIQTLKKRIDQRTEPTFTAWREILLLCRENIDHKPNPSENWAIPGYYENAELHLKLVNSAFNDSNIAYQAALCFRMTGDELYAAQALRILRAWATTFKTSDASLTDTKLTVSEVFSTMVVAADLLSTYGPWAGQDEALFKIFLREKILPLNTMHTKKNNWANWGLLLVTSIGAYLQDEELLIQAENQFRYLIDIQIEPDGTLPAEMDRSDSRNFHGGATKGKKGIWYTNFALMPTTTAAAILLLQGKNVYDYQSPTGGSLKSAFFRVAGWCADPQSFPYYESNNGKLDGTKYVSYFEILNKIWPDTNASKILNLNRPATSRFSFPNLTFTHGELDPENLLPDKGE